MEEVIVRHVLLSLSLLTSLTGLISSPALCSPAVASKSYMGRSSLMSFSKRYELRRTEDHVEIGVAKTGVKPEYWFRKFGKSSNGKISSSLWTDTTLCPASDLVLERVARLEAPHPIRLDLSSKTKLEVTADGTTYRLEADLQSPYEGGRIILSAGAGSPLALWIDQALSSMANCWRSTDTL